MTNELLKSVREQLTKRSEAGLLSEDALIRIQESFERIEVSENNAKCRMTGSNCPTNTEVAYAPVKVEDPTPDPELIKEETKQEEAPKPAKKATRTRKKKAEPTPPKVEEVPVEEPDSNPEPPKEETKQEEAPEGDLPDYDTAYEMVRDAYDKATQERGADVGDFLDILTGRGHAQVDDVKEVSELLELVKELNELNAG